MRDSFVDKEDDIMATRLLEQYKWTKDGRKWVFYCWIPSLNGKRKKLLEVLYTNELSIYVMLKGLCGKGL